MALETHKQRYLFFVFLVAAFVVTLPALFNGFILDDYYHRALFKYPDDLIPLGIDFWFLNSFAFLSGNPEQANYLMNHGVLPWWSFPEVKFSFFRPLSELAIALDYSLWPDNAVLMHLHSSVWFVACVFFLYRFLSLITGSTVVILACLFFILDASHGMAFGWLAARNVLIACTFCLAALLFAEKFNQSKRPAHFMLAMLLHTAALLSGEVGISSSALLLWYFLILFRAEFYKKIVLCLPVIAITLIWLLLRQQLDFGVFATGVYQDPFANPLSFILEASQPLGLALFAMLSGIPVEILANLPLSEMLLSADIFVYASVFLVGVTFPLWLKNRRAIFFLLSAVSLILPTLAGELQSRVLFIASAPALCFVAECIVVVYQRFKNNEAHWFNKIFLKGVWNLLIYVLCFLSLLSHLIFAPILLFYSQTLVASQLGSGMKQAAVSIENNQSDATVWLLVNPPLGSFAGYLPLIWLDEGIALPERTYILASGLNGLTLSRSDDNRLSITPQQGFLAEIADRVFRSDAYPLLEGEVIMLDEVLARVESLNLFERPHTVEFVFEEALEAPRYRFLCWEGAAAQALLLECNLPKVGESVFLNPVNF